ncbi:MAG: Acetyltransferase [Chloroflexi bacterium]|nr:Acetyltransferase [Chloroflexota bacterium]
MRLLEDSGEGKSYATLWKAMTIKIQRIEPHQTAEAKRVILTVAWNIYTWPASLAEIIEQFDERGELRDVDDPQSYYFDRRGTFLVAMDQEQVVGTGAVRYFERDTAELKRLWLLEAYHGQGIGYRLVKRLLSFAREAGYLRIRLLTDRRSKRAIAFYQKVGFQPITCQEDDPDDVCMEMEI